MLLIIRPCERTKYKWGRNKPYGFKKRLLSYLNESPFHLSYIYGRVETAASIQNYVCSEDSVVASQTVYLHLRARRTGSEVQKTALLIADPIPFSLSWSEMMMVKIRKKRHKKRTIVPLFKPNEINFAETTACQYSISLNNIG